MCGVIYTKNKNTYLFCALASQSKVEEKPSSQKLFDEQLSNVATAEILCLALGNVFWEKFCNVLNGA